MGDMYPLDPKPEDMRAMGEAVVDYLVDFIQGLDDAPAEATEGGIELARALRASPPEVGGDFDELFGEMKLAATKAYEFAGPGYLAYIPGGGLYTAALGEFLAQGVNRFINLWQPSPATVQIEQNVVRWLCDLFEYPDAARGLLTSGGSMANFSAIVTARHSKLGEDFWDGTYYVSEQVHASIAKAAQPGGLLRAEPAPRAHGRRAPDGRRRAPRHGPRPTGRPGSGRSSWSRPPARPTPARSIRWTTWPTSPPTRACGCTSTEPTAASSS